MEPCSGGTGSTGALYDALVARRTMGQQKVDGANAVRLVEAAEIAPQATAPRPLPPDATISVRV